MGLLNELQVDCEPSEMSFSLSVGEGQTEWASHGLSTVFPSMRSLLDISHWRMLRGVLRFNANAPAVLDEGSRHAEATLGDYLEAERYSDAFKYRYLLPMCASIWSAPNAQVLRFPVRMLVRFWVNHHLLSLTERPLWRVVRGRSRAYVTAILQTLPAGAVRTGCAVEVVRRLGAGQVEVSWRAGGSAGALESQAFDACVLATHADVSLRLLEAGSGALPLEREALVGVPYSDNDVYLHTDAALMPRDRRCWASWNCLERAGANSGGASAAACCVTYWLNRLQSFPEGTPDLFVTLNPASPPDAAKTVRRLSLAHPVFTEAAPGAQAALARVNGSGGVWHAGAWCGYGFHEDGLKAGIAVAKGLGAAVPWEGSVLARSLSPRLTFMQARCADLFEIFCRKCIHRGELRVIMPTGYEYTCGTVSAAAPWRAVLRVLDADAIVRVVRTIDIGLGEAYIEGQIWTSDLLDLMMVMSANADAARDALGTLGALQWVGAKLAYLRHAARSNTVENSRKNISYHYDAGNPMYALFLDRTMTYSSGITDCAPSRDDPALAGPAARPVESAADSTLAKLPPRHWPLSGLYDAPQLAKGGLDAAAAPADELEASQLRKLDEIIARAGLRPEHRVLEIGCGWGSMAVRIAQRTGCHVVGVTLSKEQLAVGHARVAAAGVAHLVDLRLQDYRHIEAAEGKESFDRIVSCEMLEAVGHEHLPSYFGCLGSLLKEGGRAVVQVISMKNENYASYCASSDFIREHIFPGGHLPCLDVLDRWAHTNGLARSATLDIGRDYAVTLKEWRVRWNTNQAAIEALGYSREFWRMYDFYFAYCEAGFFVEFLHDFIISFDKDAAAAKAAAAKGSWGTTAPLALGAAAAAIAAAAYAYKR